MGVGTSDGIFRGGAPVDFSKSFSRGGQKWWNFFFPLETKKTAFFAEIFKFLPLFQHPCLCARNIRSTQLENWVIPSILPPF